MADIDCRHMGHLMTGQRICRRWVEAADFRHATEGRLPRVGDVVDTLCGVSATVITPKPGMYAPECPACDVVWRSIEGIPQRAEHLLNELP
jgi:hypothetical protein